MSNTLSWSDFLKDAGDSGNFEPLPVGEYDVKILEATATRTGGQEPKTMFKVKAEVQTGAYAKRLLWDNLVVSPDKPAALGFFFRKMKALGLGAEFFQTNPSNAQIEQALVGRQAKAKVIQRTWQGEVRNNIDSYAPAAGGAAPSFSPPPSAPAAPPAAPPAAAPVAPAPQAAPAAPPAAPSVAPPSQIGQPAAAPASPWDTVAPPQPPATPF